MNPIEEMLKGLTVTPEVVELKEGETIEQVVKDRGFKPIGEDCENCGMHHTYEAPDGTMVFAFGEKHEVKKPPNEEKRAKALQGIRNRQARVARMVDLLEQMEYSVMHTTKERTVDDVITELALYMELKSLADSI